MCFINVGQMGSVANEHGLYDIHCLVFVLETGCMVSFCKCSHLLEKNIQSLVIGYRSLCALLTVVAKSSISLLMFVSLSVC